MGRSQNLDRVVEALEEEHVVVRVVGWTKFLSYKGKKIEIDISLFEWFDRLKLAIDMAAGKEIIIYKTPIMEYSADEVYSIKII